MYLLNSIKNPNYLKALRSKPCAICGRPGPSEPHHIRNLDGPTGVGCRPSDYLALPACRHCHDKDQRYEKDADPVLDRWRKDGMKDRIIFHLIEYLEEQRHGSK